MKTSSNKITHEIHELNWLFSWSINYTTNICGRKVIEYQIMCFPLRAVSTWVKIMVDKQKELMDPQIKGGKGRKIKGNEV